ncbi:MAG: glycosyltransferase family 39 protein [Chloroflexota bacterium]|nr:glycosyltransferase family 39 protein [Chloroflexota bacterium]
MHEHIEQREHGMSEQQNSLASESARDVLPGMDQSIEFPIEDDGEDPYDWRSLLIFVAAVAGVVVASALLTPPTSTIVMVLVIGLALGYALLMTRTPLLASMRARTSQITLPAIAAPRVAVPTSWTFYRNVLSAVGAVGAMALFIGAAQDFDPLLNQAYMRIGVEKMVAGAILLALAIWLSSRRPPLAQPIREPLSEARGRWRAVTIGGALLLLALSEINGMFLNIDGVQYVHINIQHLMLFAGAILTVYGLGGAPRIDLKALRVPREEWLTAAAVVAVLIFALVVRLWNQENTLRSLIDELHWSDGIQRVALDPWTPILYPMSGQSPYTFLFPYWQTGAVAIFGYNFTGFRFVSAICGVLTVLATYGLGRAIFDRWTAVLGMLALAAFPPAIHFSRVAMPLIGDPLFGTMAVMFIARALRRNHRIEWAAAGVSLGFSQYFYEGGRLLFPALVVGWLIVLAVSGHLRGRWRGVVILFAAFIMVGLPVYYTIIGNDQPLFGRMDVSGDSSINSRLSDGLSLEDLLTRGQHMLTAFMMYGAHWDLSAYYGGQQALVNTIVLPAFLFGAFYLLFRFPAPAFVIPLWIVATGMGNGLLRDTLVSARYYVVLPPLALAIMAGIRYFLPFVAGLVPPVRADGRMTRPWRLAMAATVGLSMVIAGYHVWYYYGPHLAFFNIQVRESKGYRDGIDAALRAVELPGNTQVYLVGQPEHDQNVPRHWLTFLGRDAGQNPDRYFPLRSFPTALMSPRYLRDLDRGVNYAFFVEAESQETMNSIYTAFPQASPPQYTPDNVPAHKAYVLIWVPTGIGS